MAADADLLAIGDRVVWNRQHPNQRNVERYIREYGEGPFEVMETPEESGYKQCVIIGRAGKPIKTIEKSPLRLSPEWLVREPTAPS